MKPRKRTYRKGKPRRVTKRKGGASIEGAPLGYSLSDDWSSRMSHGQGGDYLKYHVGQHGGEAPYPQSFDSALPPALRGPALLNGLDQSFVDIKGMTDQAGGRRRCSCRRSCKHKRRSNRRPRHRSRRNRRSNRRSRRSRRSRRRGGSLGYSPYGANPMLLDSATAYAQAGLNPEWKTDVAFTDAAIRDTQ